MLKRLLIASVSLCIISSCSYDRKENLVIRNKLENIDHSLWCLNESDMKMSWREGLDSLIVMDIRRMSNANEAYYNLMYVILCDKTTGNDFDTDSIIDWSLMWYRNSDDYYNYTRALLYRGITKIRIDPRDYTAFNHLKEAQIVYEKHSLDDKYLLGNIYHYLGKINMNVGNYKEARQYFLSRYSMNGEIGWPVDNLSSQIDYSYLEIELGDYTKAKDLIDELTLVYDVPRSLYNMVLELEISYFEIFDDYTSSIEACLRYEPGNLSEEIVREYSFSRLYKEYGMMDSAYFHAGKLVKCISDTSMIENYIYYNLAADIFDEMGEYEKASHCYFLSREYHYLELEQTRDNKILELEVKYRSLVKEQEILKLKELNGRVFFICIILSLLIIVLLLVISMIRSRHKQNAFFMKLNESKLRNVELLKTVMDASLGLLPSFQEEVYSIVVRHSASSEKALQEFNNISGSVKKELKARLAKVVDEGAIRELDPLFHNLDEFSTQEQIILFLSYLDSKSDFIAKVLNTSPSSIRGMKSRIREKTTSSVLLSGDKKEKIFSFL